MESNDASMAMLAERLNVATSTVSRALAGRPGVSAEKAREICAVAKDMGYQPSLFRRKRTDAIALIIASDKPDFSKGAHSYLARLVARTEQQASEFGWHVHVAMIPRFARNATLPALISEGRVDGVLLAGHPPEEFCLRLAEEDIPVVVINDSSERIGLTCVTTTSLIATREAIGRFVQAGHRRFGLVLADRRFPTVDQRYHAWIAALQSNGIDEDGYRVIQPMEYNMGGGQQAVVELDAVGTMPGVIIFCTDLMALGGMYELARRGYRVPEDVSVMGYDNVLAAEHLNPRLTSIDMQLSVLIDIGLHRLGQQAEGDGGPVVTETIPAKLFWRDSCGAKKTEKK